jgi:hypothetical protein
LADLRDLGAANQSFEDIAFWASNQYNLRLDGDSRQVMAGQVRRRRVAPRRGSVCDLHPGTASHASGAGDRAARRMKGKGGS